MFLKLCKDIQIIARSIVNFDINFPYENRKIDFEKQM